MALNNMMHLVGDYHSDSENEESALRSKHTNNIVTNWTQCTDVSTGHPYYWNIVTKEVTWEMPNEYKEFLDRAKILHPNDLIKWTLCYTDDNTPYYFNDLTREISWVKPENFVEPEQQNHTKEKNSKPEPQIKSKFNLVPEYNSDDSDDEFPKQSQDEPLFPSSGNSCHTAQITLKNAFNSHDQSNSSEKPAKRNSRSNSSHSSNSGDLMAKKMKPSFASIITGGRSPQNESEIQKYIGESHENPSESSETSMDQSKEPEILSQKTFKRKRRIEFSAGKVCAKKLNQNDDQIDKDDTTEHVESLPNENSTLRNYGNFQKGETAFSERTTTNTPNHLENNKHDDDNNLQKNQEITDQHSLLESKLKFLAQGRTDVSPVQVIQIQLEALQIAHTAEALHSDYFLEWMKSISNDLIKLENDAAPSGWKCLWNREQDKYCYENTTTAEIRWEYPEIEQSQSAALENNVLDNDEMDISNSPPPNPEYHHPNEFNEHVTPPPPKWSTEQTDSTQNEKPLDDELATFYSDIAKLEPNEMADGENSSDKPPTDNNNELSASPDNNAEEAQECGGGSGGGDVDDKKKKKKKKAKKLEPWRSGNLETWINKWQKAQKELDG